MYLCPFDKFHLSENVRELSSLTFSIWAFKFSKDLLSEKKNSVFSW